MDSGQDTLAGGFPHSEIRGSKLTRSSPRLIAACHVLHRLSVPRHPPDALKTLDLSVPRAGAMPPRRRLIHSPAGKTGRTALSIRIDPTHHPKPHRRRRVRWTSSRPVAATQPHGRPRRATIWSQTLFTLYKNRRPTRPTLGAETTANRKPLHSGSHEHPMTPSLAFQSKLVEADGIEPTTSSLQS